MLALAVEAEAVSEAPAVMEARLLMQTYLEAREVKHAAVPSSRL